VPVRCGALLSPCVSACVIDVVDIVAASKLLCFGVSDLPDVQPWGRCGCQSSNFGLVWYRLLSQWSSRGTVSGPVCVSMLYGFLPIFTINHVTLS
jgi:hypothetical protein